MTCMIALSIPRMAQFRHIVGLSSQGSARSFSRGLFPNIDVQLSEAPPQDPVLQVSFLSENM